MDHAATDISPRKKHLNWCKERATEYVKNGDLASAVASMVSDMNKSTETAIPPVLSMLGMMEISNGASAVQRWIDGFN